MAQRLVLFDCDGTLVDSQYAIHEALAGAFNSCELEPPTRHQVRQIIGLPLDRAIAQLHPDGSADVIHTLVQDYKEKFTRQRQRADHHEPMFPGMRDALGRLAADGALLGVVTGKGHQGLCGVLAQHDGIESYFVTLQTADSAPGKPDPAMVYQAMAQAGVPAAETVVIGDTTFDMAMAVSAGVASVGVEWGYHDTLDLRLAGADRIAAGPGDLITVVDELLPNRTVERGS